MYNFSEISKLRLLTCDNKLQLIANELIKHMDVTILCGHRNQLDQNEVFKKGFSQVDWPRSKHNILPSRAIDIMPYPVNWHDFFSIGRMIGFIHAIAIQHNIDLRFGSEWEDYCHIELC